MTNIQCVKCVLGFGGRVPWFSAYIQHPVLIPTSALLSAHHPFSPLPQTPSNLSSLYLRVSCGLTPSLKLFFPFPSPMVFC